MPFADLRFLVVEDHEFQRRALVSLLTRLGSKVVYDAEDGRSALQIVQDPARPVDIVVSDLEMPGMDGMEFIRHLGAAETRVSLILASALERKLIASIGTMTEAYGIKLLGIVEKPLTTAKLEALIRLHDKSAVAAARPRPAGPSFTLAEIVAAVANEEFEPFYQPKVEMAAQRVRGAEALARWCHPTLGTIAPFAFIPTLEEHRLIDDLTWLMLRKSAAQCSRWRATGLELSVSVNLSLVSLSDLQLADRITDIVRGQNLDPRHMVLEITESAATTDLAKVLENLARLRVKGFGLSIDDYGTGYSSMQQLSRIAFTELKIDQAFVANAAREASTRVILASSLDMARKLNIDAVAEGVETRDDWDLLLQLGCGLAQGYLVARPMQAATFEGWLNDWKGLA